MEWLILFVVILGAIGVIEAVRVWLDRLDDRLEMYRRR